jgi:hypothetical protein
MNDWTKPTGRRLKTNSVGLKNGPLPAKNSAGKQKKLGQIQGFWRSKSSGIGEILNLKDPRLER